MLCEAMADRPKLLVSACLLGSPVRYDGSAKSFADDALARWQREGRIVSVCPEIMGGFPTPRPPAEIADMKDGGAVLDGSGRVIEAGGKDVTAAFVDGAHAALRTAQKHDCRFALLTDGSPSCGSIAIYDGSFTGRKHANAGVTATLLRRHEITVFAPSQIGELEALMDR